MQVLESKQWQTLFFKEQVLYQSLTKNKEISFYFYHQLTHLVIRLALLSLLEE